MDTLLAMILSYLTWFIILVIIGYFISPTMSKNKLTPKERKKQTLSFARRALFLLIIIDIGSEFMGFIFGNLSGKPK
ncbi:hypothetical protein SAMN04488500_107172 [Sporomusa malonica]|uniref:Uncharacterized protein n=2 Tax=Sporomusa malonica TaxID=112901 RepID=A0A1W2BGY6_9FIRM|nr:hypothetical protein SAMN04488500_107172 [Sporomusa malonica]